AMSSDDFATLRLARVGQVLRVTIDHPSSPLNAVDGRLHHDLTALFARLKRENDARAVLLTGRGRAFSAGGDFDWFPALQATRRPWHSPRGSPPVHRSPCATRSSPSTSS